jgi:hypothetical protein
VLVPVVEIRRVWMRVREGLVFVRMRMAHPSRQPWVHVSMVAVVVTVAVRVRQVLVGMGVLVSGRQHHGQSRDHESAGRQLGSGDALPEKAPGQQRPE